MRIPRIYTHQPLCARAQLELEPGASHHLLKVLRMVVGRELVLFNGKGSEFPAKIIATGKKIAVVETFDEITTSRESPLETELAIGISRGERMDWVLQKATELGVSRIVPLFTERTEVKLTGDRLTKKIEQWGKIIQGACEQSQRNRLPVLSPSISLPEYIETCTTHLRFVLHHRSEHRLGNFAKPESVALLIGPEGGLSDDEITMATSQDFAPLTLGPRVMRTETAPIAALSLMQYCWGDF